MGSAPWTSLTRSSARSSTTPSIPEPGMPAHKRPHTIPILWYILSDYVAALLASILFHFSRRILLDEPLYVNGHLWLTPRFWLGTTTIPLGWLIFYSFVGFFSFLFFFSWFFVFFFF